VVQRLEEVGYSLFILERDALNVLDSISYSIKNPTDLLLP
jgi:hypothetical protein